MVEALTSEDNEVYVYVYGFGSETIATFISVQAPHAKLFVVAVTAAFNGFTTTVTVS